MDGDYSFFDIDIKTKISENSVREVEKINLGSYSNSIHVCTGTFKFPFEQFEKLNKYKIAEKLDELLFACQIRKYFD